VPAATSVGYWLEPGKTSPSSAHPLADAGSIIPSTSRRPPMYCNRTATGLIRAGTQRTQDWLSHTENRLNKRNFRTHQYGLERVQANS
jgi:hypothetical protein